MEITFKLDEDEAIELIRNASDFISSKRVGVDTLINGFSQHISQNLVKSIDDEFFYCRLYVRMIAMADFKVRHGGDTTSETNLCRRIKNDEIIIADIMSGTIEADSVEVFSLLLDNDII